MCLECVLVLDILDALLVLEAAVAANQLDFVEGLGLVEAQSVHSAGLVDSQLPGGTYI